MKSPHIAFVIASMNGGGAQRVMSDMASYWASCSYNVSLITTGETDARDTYALHPHVERLRLGQRSGPPAPRGAGGTLRRVVQLRRALAQLAPDIVISFIDVTNVMTILATRGLGVSVAVCERTDPSVNPTIGPAWRLLRRLTYRHADRVVAQTAAAVKWLDRQCAVRSVAIPNPIRALPIAAEPRGALLVAAGRLDRHKGFDVVLRSFALVRRQFPDWRLVILGDGPEKATLLKLRSELGVDAAVELMGEVGDVEDWFARASIVVHGSRFEGFPNVILEAMAMGAAVVATDCRSGPADLIHDGVNGRLAPVDDVDGMAAAIVQLIADPAMRARLGSEAVFVRERYAIGRIVRQWNELLGLPPLISDENDAAAPGRITQR